MKTHEMYSAKAHLATLNEAALLAELPHLAPAVHACREDVIRDLAGDDGEAALLAGQRVLLDAAVRTMILLEVADRWIFARPSLVTMGQRVIPLLDHRDRLLGRLEKLLERLGALTRRPPKVPTIAELMAAVESQEVASAPTLVQDGTQSPELTDKQSG